MLVSSGMAWSWTIYVNLDLEQDANLWRKLLFYSEQQNLQFHDMSMLYGLDTTKQFSVLSYIIII